MANNTIVDQQNFYTQIGADKKAIYTQGQGFYNNSNRNRVVQLLNMIGQYDENVDVASVAADADLTQFEQDIEDFLIGLHYNLTIKIKGWIGNSGVSRESSENQIMSAGEWQAFSETISNEIIFRGVDNGTDKYTIYIEDAQTPVDEMRIELNYNATNVFEIESVTVVCTETLPSAGTIDYFRVVQADMIHKVKAQDLKTNTKLNDFNTALAFWKTANVTGYENLPNYTE